MAGIALAKFRVAFDAWHEPLVARRAVQSESEIGAVLRETYGANDCMNQLLLEHVDARAWRARQCRREKQAGRTHACRNFRPSAQQSPVLTKNSAPHLRCPAPLDPARCTIKQTRAAHRQGAARCLEMLKDVRKLGAKLACGSNDVQLHVRARGASPKAGDHAGTSTGIQAAGQSHVWDLAMGEILEAVRF